VSDRERGASTAADPATEIESVVPAVGAVVRDGGRVLVVRDRARGDWLVPTGRLEPAESVREAVRREVREEAAVESRVDRLAGVYSDPSTQVFEHRSGAVNHFVTTLAVCSVPDAAGPDPAPDGEETDRARFVARGDLPEMDPVGDWVEAALAGETVLR